MTRLVEAIKAVEIRKRLTGQLFFRYMGPTIELDFSDRDLFAVVGNLAVPKGLIKTEHQLSLAGYESNVTNDVILGLDTKRAKNFKKQFRGYNLGDTLLQPIWKI